MKTLILVEYGVRISYRNGSFIITCRDFKKTVSPLEVDQVIVASSGVLITSKAVRKMIEYGIDLVFLDSRGQPIGRVYPPFINRTVDTRRKQYMIYNTDRATEIIRALVKAKALNQAGLLKRYYHITREKLLKDTVYEIMDLVKEIEEYRGPFMDAKEHFRVREAMAARLYWEALSMILPRDIGFNGRDTDSIDPFNISINYGYGILYKECWSAIVLAGLDPYAGFMHVDRSGKPVLVYDFIEQFRFIVDFPILKMLRRGWRPEVSEGLLKHSSRTKIIEAITRFMDEAKVVHANSSTPTTLRQAIKRKAFQLASYIRGEKNFYEGLVWNW